MKVDDKQRGLGLGLRAGDEKATHPGISVFWRYCLQDLQEDPKHQGLPGSKSVIQREKRVWKKGY